MLLPLQSIFWETTSRSGAVVARWAHNPKVACSNQASATIIKDATSKSCVFCHKYTISMVFHNSSKRSIFALRNKNKILKWQRFIRNLLT